jgi:ElaB/YqjD/DUF883 family membrane-anchored ribosome-binding protein
VFAVSARRAGQATLLACLLIAMEANVPCIVCRSRGWKTAPDFGRNILTTLQTVTETASELGKQTRESIEELGRSAGRKLDEARDQTGATLHSAASSVRSTGRESSAAIDNCSTHTADRLDATGLYIENHDLGDAVTGLRRFARRHLTGSLVAAGTIGVLAGAFLSRATHTCGRSADSAQR